MRQELDVEKTLNAILYITNVIGEADFHKIFKILYFADQKHLAKYGELISGERYIAMKDGAVPSTVYDVFKHLRGEPNWIVDENKINPFREAISVKNWNYIAPNTKADLEIFTEDELSCIKESIEENKDLSFSELPDKSHSGLAYREANRDDEIYPIEIAREGGANGEMIKYISINLENKQPHYVIKPG